MFNMTTALSRNEKRKINITLKYEYFIKLKVDIVVSQVFNFSLCGNIFLLKNN